MKTHGRVEIQLHRFLTSVLDGGEWSASRHDHFATRERDPDTHWIGGWVSHRDSLEAVAKKKYLFSCWESNLDRQARSLVTIKTELPQLPSYVAGAQTDG
jgi:hypothetical protein